MFTAYQLHLPDDLRVFHYHAPPTYYGPDGLVFDGQTLPGVPGYARSYLFRQRWLEIFLTLDDRLQFLPDAQADFAFVFNCDLTTPYIIEGETGYTIDLWLDVLVAADGHTYKVEDGVALEAAAKDQLIPLDWYDAVQRELTWLTDLLDTQQFLPMLQDIAPFPTQPPAALLSTLTRTAPTLTNFPDLRQAPFAIANFAP